MTNIQAVTTIQRDGFFLSQDSSSHWFIVPRRKQVEWEAWTNLPEDDPDAWDAPQWAKPLNRHPNSVTFYDYFVEE